METPRYTFFIAHAGADTDRARELYGLLHPQIPCFLDAEDLTPGDDWPTTLRAAQQASLATLALISDRSDAAYYLGDEIHSAIAYQRADPERHRLVPLYLDGLPAQPEAVPYGLRVKHALDVRATGVAAVVARLADLAEIIRQQGASLPQAAPAVRRAGNRLRLYRALCSVADDAFEELLFDLGAPQRTSLEGRPPRSVRARNLVEWAEERGPEQCDALAAAVRQRVPAFRWLDQRRKDLGRVNVPGPDYDLPFNASDLVVSLQLQVRPAGRAERDDAQPSAADVVTVDFRRALRIAALRPDCVGLAIIGDPGSGKTTVLQQMFCEAHDSGSEAIGLPPGLTPVFVRCKVFKDLGAPADWSFRRVVEAQAKADGREGASAELWSGEWPLLLLLDGLDEVPTEALRAQICAWLMREAVKLHGVWYFVVTSRIATWRRSATLRDELFLTADALSLDEPSIRGYVERWFRAVALKHRTDEGGAAVLEEQAAAEAKKLLDELYSDSRRLQRSLHELMGNPLSLALLCQVHTRHVAIPQRLGDLYDACLNVFLDRRAREQERPFLPATAARAVLRPLAWRMQDAAEEDVAMERVEAGVADTLARLQLQDLRGIDAREFVRRAWEECGLFRSRDFKKLGFFHAALREYLAACHALKEGLLADLARRADEARWRNVLLLATSLEGGFSGLARELIAAHRLAGHEALLREGLHSVMSIEPQPFREALQAGAVRGGWRARLRRLAGMASDGPCQDDVLAMLRILEGREIPELRDAVEPLVRDQRPLVRSAARRYLGHAQGVASLKHAEPGQVWREPLTGIAFVWIPPGEFLMGDAPGVRVTLPTGFWIGQHPVTNEAYGRFLAAARHRKPEYWRNSRFYKPYQPVVGVDFADALAFCAWATKAAAFDDDREITLPTEAEWEYVAGAAGGDGQLREYPWGNEPPTPERAVFHPSPGTAPVGGRPTGATPLGVHDLAGNVWEWCLDVHKPGLPGGRDPLVWEPPESAAPRAVRGGSWRYGARRLRAAGRLRYVPGSRHDSLGFRVVCRGSRQHA
jgi:formylglycine-generating enzyme required for sulfatase activity